MMQRRKQSEAKRIENELNAKNQAEGKTERVEVDVDSVDWLYGTYKLKGDESKEGVTSEGETKAETEPKETVVSEPEKLSEAEMDALPVISRNDPSKDSDTSVFSAPSSK